MPSLLPLLVLLPTNDLCAQTEQSQIQPAYWSMKLIKRGIVYGVGDDFKTKNLKLCNLKKIKRTLFHLQNRKVNVLNILHHIVLCRSQWPAARSKT
jgi:hypothetical protein